MSEIVKGVRASGGIRNMGKMQRIKQEGEEH